MQIKLTDAAAGRDSIDLYDFSGKKIHTWAGSEPWHGPERCVDDIVRMLNECPWWLTKQVLDKLNASTNS